MKTAGYICSTCCAYEPLPMRCSHRQTEMLPSEGCDLWSDDPRSPSQREWEESASAPLEGQLPLFRDDG